jgi:hypothetical protein
VGEFGTFAPIAAASITGGYEVAWRLGTTSSYVVWNTDANGNYRSSPTGLVGGTDPVLENVETSFGFDLNGDGTIGLKTTTLESAGANSLLQVGNEYLVQNGSNPAVTLKYQGNAVTVGEFGTFAPIAAASITGGYEVAWRLGTTSSYVVWNTDANGNYQSSPTGVIIGQSFALEVLETGFGFDLNGDGHLSTQLVTAGATVDLTGLAQTTTVHLGGDTASASSGLNPPSLTFLGTPDAITIGMGATTVEYTLQAASGIETVANFRLGTDLLNIDLNGAANGALLAYDTTVGGVHAIALASSADLAHGVVLLNAGSSLTAANLLSAHTVFLGGHALIS